MILNNQKKKKNLQTKLLDYAQLIYQTQIKNSPEKKKVIISIVLEFVG